MLVSSRNKQGRPTRKIGSATLPADFGRIVALELGMMTPIRAYKRPGVRMRGESPADRPLRCLGTASALLDFEPQHLRPLVHYCYFPFFLSNFPDFSWRAPLTPIANSSAPHKLLASSDFRSAPSSRWSKAAHWRAGRRQAVIAASARTRSTPCSRVVSTPAPPTRATAATSCGWLWSKTTACCRPSTAKPSAAGRWKSSCASSITVWMRWSKSVASHRTCSSPTCACRAWMASR